MTIRFRSRYLISSLLVCASIAGCGSGPALGEVGGTVTSDGKPLSGIQVVFSPDVGKGEDGRSSAAVTDENGRYVLMFDDKKSPRPGAMVGRHKVILVDVAWEDARGNPNRRSRRVAEEHGLFATTPLEFEVRPGPQTIPIEIKR